MIAYSDVCRVLFEAFPEIELQYREEAHPDDVDDPIPYYVYETYLGNRIQQALRTDPTGREAQWYFAFVERLATEGDKETRNLVAVGICEVLTRDPIAQAAMGSATLFLTAEIDIHNLNLACHAYGEHPEDLGFLDGRPLQQDIAWWLGASVEQVIERATSALSESRTASKETRDWAATWARGRQRICPDPPALSLVPGAPQDWWHTQQHVVHLLSKAYLGGDLVLAKRYGAVVVHACRWFAS